jgi:hypothetical protein
MCNPFRTSSLTACSGRGRSREDAAQRTQPEMFRFVNSRNPTCKPLRNFSCYMQSFREHNTENTVEQENGQKNSANPFWKQQPECKRLFDGVNDCIQLWLYTGKPLIWLVLDNG